MVESIARVRHIRVTPQKARRVVNLIRGKQAQEALAILKFAPQGASEPGVQAGCLGHRERARQGRRLEHLPGRAGPVHRQAFVDEGTTLKRFQPRAQGRAFQIHEAHQPHHRRARHS